MPSLADLLNRNVLNKWLYLCWLIGRYFSGAVPLLDEAFLRSSQKGTGLSEILRFSPLNHIHTDDILLDEVHLSVMEYHLSVRRDLNQLAWRYLNCLSLGLLMQSGV